MIIVMQTLFFFRESLMNAFDRAFRPYYKRFSLVFYGKDEETEEEEPDEQVFAEFDEEKGVVFFPPVYAQRYAAVSDCLMDERWCGKLEKVVDFGYHDMSFIKYLKEVPGIQRILGVDLESYPLKCSSDLFTADEYSPRRETPLQVTLFQGNAADPDYRLIGCDAVVAIEMIEHMLPHDLDRFVHNVFGFIKPWVVVLTTPNGDFNVLFKALEKNGLRLLDHFFEWSREQFHEWCSNIVVRYPDYTVTCQGIGPGPPGTQHHGCCSQLALFVNKHYHKQQDLDLNSLALIPKAPSPKPLKDLVDSWDSPDERESTPTGTEANIESIEYLCSNNQSHMTLVFTPAMSSSLTFSQYQDEAVTLSDKISQCNLDTEIGKNFLMFDEEHYYEVRTPRRPIRNKVYVIEDVACRLNCTTLQVNKFSKTTQNLMAKNKIDSLVHTREVVDEIRNLTRALNINKCIVNGPEDGPAIWCNINWGDNAPYWNQYYKVVREYNCPFEAKSEDTRILDLVSDEINRMIDTQLDEFSCDTNCLEIPLSHLMTVVQHITDDVDMVRDLLEWNGYEVAHDMVIHSRLVVDNASTHCDDWNEDPLSDWDNTSDVRSTTVSEGSTIVPDYYDRCLRRALDHKVHNLRTMLSADEDITTELDKVVCRLMKLALKSSKGQPTAPPSKWMQSKLLDLLTLTEKAIERRKKHLVENKLRALEFPFMEDVKEEFAKLIKKEDDDIAKQIVNEYHDIVSPIAASQAIYENNSDPDDDFMSASNEFDKDLPYADRTLVSPELPPIIFTTKDLELSQPEIPLNSMERTKAWLEVDVRPEAQKDITPDYEFSNKNKQKPKDSKHKTDTKRIDSRTSSKCKFKQDEKKRKTSNTRITKKVTRKVSGCYISKHARKYQITDGDRHARKTKRGAKETDCVTVKATKPIPGSLIDLCHPELKGAKDGKEFNNFDNNQEADRIVISNESKPTMDTKDSLLMGITNNEPEIKTSHKSIGTDAEETLIEKVQFEVLGSDVDVNRFTTHEVSKENLYSQTIFLNDINEPSTSKGIRRNIGMDVQCGPDTLAAYPKLSASTSFVKIPQMYTAGIDIHDRVADTKVQDTDFGTSTQESWTDKVITPRSRSVGIKIKDSDVNICIATDDSALNRNHNLDVRGLAHGPRSWSPESNGIVSKEPLASSHFKTDLSKAEPSIAKSTSCHEVCSTDQDIDLKSDSELVESLIEIPETLKPNPSQELSSTPYSKPKLSRGGVYVHSYKEKQESEDIVYQGEWQRYKANYARKKNYNTIVAKKINDSGNRKQRYAFQEKIVNSKDNVVLKKSEKNLKKIDNKKPMPNAKFERGKEVTGKLESDNFKCARPKTVGNMPNSKKPAKPVNNVTKVASKIAMSSKPSKNLKSAFTVKKPHITTNFIGNKTDVAQKLKNDYIPLYIRRRKEAQKTNIAKSIDSSKTEAAKNEINVIKNPTLSKSAVIKHDLFRFRGDISKSTYVVYRNEKHDNCDPCEEQVATTTNNTDNTIQNNSYRNRTRSPKSGNSSTCSSPNSIATVRAAAIKPKNVSYRRYSASSHKSILNTSESDNASSTKTNNKKNLKRIKNGKKSDNNKDSNNKENIPEVNNFACKETEELAKSPFIGQKKEVCVAQLKTDHMSSQATDTLSKHKASTKSNIIMPKVDDVLEKGSPSVNWSRKNRTKSRTSINSKTDFGQSSSSDSSECANMVLLLNPQQLLPCSKDIAFTNSAVKTVENHLHSGWIQNSNIDTKKSNVTNHMKQIVEELLDFVDYSGLTVDSRLLVSPHEFDPADSSDSTSSFKTVMADYLNSTFLGNYSLNRTFDSVLGDESVISLWDDTKLAVTDLDMSSFKSIASDSKHSEYFLANSELNTVVPPTERIPEPVLNENSVTDIFERKETCFIQNPAGALASQAFSGFSIDGEPETGDKPDPISLIDSETGSLAMDVERRTTSEELYVSSRSSQSFGSFLIDEDAVVPNWLFQIISQQQQQLQQQQQQPVEIEDLPIYGPQPAPPLVDPMYDVNGNAIEPGVISASAGAGDGCGIHSDQSQDSSGRGTSYSSSDDTLSSQASETSLLDPAAQMELLSEPTTSSVLEAEPSGIDLRDANHEAIEGHEGVVPVTNVPGPNGRRLRRPLRTANACDADISSISTDVIDSD